MRCTSHQLRSSHLGQRCCWQLLLHPHLLLLVLLACKYNPRRGGVIVAAFAVNRRNATQSRLDS
jgi:hypothetical protein